RSPPMFLPRHRTCQQVFWGAILMRRHSWFAGVVCCGLSGLTLIGCGESSSTPTSDKESAASKSPLSKDVKSLLEKGISALQKRQWQPALQALTEAIKLDPKCADAYFHRASLLADVGQAAAALGDYDHALKLNPDNISALNNRGLAYFALKDYERAAADFTQAIARDRYNAKFYLERRECLLKLDRHEEAQGDAAKVAWLGKLNELNRSVSQEPKAANNYVELAEHLIAGGEPRVGLASFETAIKIKPDYGKSYSSRAAYWLSQGDLDKAISDCDRALKVEPHFEAYSVRGDAYLQKGDDDRAIADYQKARRLDTQVANAYLLRAKQRRAAGKSVE